VIVEYIDAHREELGVDPICRVLSEQAGVQIAPSTYYAAKLQGPVSMADLDDAYDANTLFDLWTVNRGVYGVRKLWHAAKRAGHCWGRDRVARLMGIGGIDGVVRGRRATGTTERDESAPPRHPDLIDRAWWAPMRPDQWWVADFTYVWTLQGFCYTAFCVDVFSRRILGWRVMTSKTTALVTSVLEQALFTRQYAEFRFTATGLVHHSDYAEVCVKPRIRGDGLCGRGLLVDSSA
jgi:putative transposase